MFTLQLISVYFLCVHPFNVHVFAGLFEEVPEPDKFIEETVKALP